MNPTEQAHFNLRNILLNGRILLNGLPPTATEIGTLIQGLQMLFAKASKLDAAQALVAKQAKPKEPKDPNVVPFNKEGKK